MPECEICGVEHGSGRYYLPGPLRILITTFPKTGTNLISQVFGNPRRIAMPKNLIFGGIGDIPLEASLESKVARELLAFEGVALGHIFHTQTFHRAVHSRPTIVFQLVRDPKDVIVSHFEYVRSRPDVRMNFPFADGKLLSEREDPIMDLIELSPKRWKPFLAWIKYSHTVKFEDLIINPIATCNEIIRLVPSGQRSRLGISSSGAMVRRINPSNSVTFRKGKAGEWVSYFNDAHLRKYIDVGMLKIEEKLGYAGNI
jgi:hypothetical protein